MNTWLDNGELPNADLEEGGGLLDTGGAAHLPDGMHAQLDWTEIQCGDAELGWDYWPDGGPAWRVIAGDKVLKFVVTNLQ